MNLKIFFNATCILYILIFLCSCEDTKPTVADNRTHDTTSLFDPPFISRMTTFSNIFIFDSIENMSTFEQKYLATNEINFNDETETDTIILFTNTVDTIIYAKAYSGTFLWKMNILSNSVKLDTNVGVGCLKSFIQLKLRQNKISDFVSVWGEDAAETLYITFKNDTVSNIRYEMHFEAVN